LQLDKWSKSNQTVLDNGIIRKLMDKIEAMRRFVAVVQTGSFTQAAENLNAPKSAISNSVSQLEAHLCTRLLQRSTRRVSLTEAGERYLPQCLLLLEALEVLDLQFQMQSPILTGTICVDMPSRFLSTIVMPRLQEWFDRHPQTQIRVIGADYRIDPIKEQVDCVIRVGELDDSELIAKRLGTMKMVNCASPEYIKKYGSPTSLEDLSHHFIVDYAPNRRQNNAAFEYYFSGTNHNLAMSSLISVSTTDAYLSAGLNGLGIIQLPEGGITNYLQQKKLVVVLPQYCCQDMPVSIVYESKRHLPKKLRYFMDWINHIYSQHSHQ
jgi:DNA-binding transcriptional LysR family regulator